MPSPFVHLQVHSEYSLADGLTSPKALVAQAARLGMPALALTDRSNMFAQVRFYKAAMAAGVKPIIGVDAWLRNPDDAGQPFRLVLLAQDRTGYGNLTVLLSRAYREGQHLGRPMLDRDWLDAEQSRGLIMLSGGREGDVGRALTAGNLDEARQRLRHWERLFGDRYYLQLSRTGREGEEDYLQEAVDLAIAEGVPVVATNEACFLTPDDFQAHEVRVCIHDGRTLDDPRRPRNYSAEQYLRSPQEMAELFADLPEALENTFEIARRCNVELELGRACLPDFPIPDGMDMAGYFRQQSRAGLAWRLQRLPALTEALAAEREARYSARLELELDVIISMGFPGYFLIVADFIQWAKDHGIPVGPGRGSGAGSLVAYALKITDLDPIEHDLLFERFLNPERISMPDFDVDFCMDRRDDVIDYVARRYGRDSVSQIITFGSMAAKAVVRDVGRVLGHPYGFTDRIAKMVPFELGMTLDKALEDSEELRQAYETDQEVSQLIDMARKLEGLARNPGKHAGGVVIAPGKLTDFSPLYCEADGQNLVTQFDKDDVEQVGLVKFDFLGLRTLTIIDWALKSVNEQRQHKGEPPIDINAIDMADAESFALLKRAETTAVFQLESHGMKELIRKLQPDCFDDITALVALFRPGPLQSGMVDDFIARKHGRQKVSYPHPALEPILKSTYGVILYQEQVMQIAQELAGYTLGGADLLRRAMGKKKPEEMAKQRQVFMQGAVSRGVEEATATYIFDLMEKFAGYGFNKSHSAAYALVAYQTLWLKAHYPAAFMAAVLSADMDHTDKVVGFIDECRKLGLEVTPPDINSSGYRFGVKGDRCIPYGLGAIKGVGGSAIDALLEVRDRAGAFADLFDFCRRIDLRKVNRRVLEALIRAGALDPLGANRATLMMQLPLALRMAEQHQQQKAAGQNDLFGLEPVAEARERPELGLVPEALEEWDEDQRLQGEKETLGLFLTGHPIEFYEAELAQTAAVRLGDLSPDWLQGQGGGNPPGRSRGRPASLTGMVISVQRRNTQRGAMASVLLDDRTGRIEATLFNETYERYRDVLAVDRVLVFDGQVQLDEFRGGVSLRVERVCTPDERRAESAVLLDLLIPESDLPPADFVAQLNELLAPHLGGQVGIRLQLKRNGLEATVRLGEFWRVRPTDELLRQLRRRFGEGCLCLRHGPPRPPRQDEVRQPGRFAGSVAS